MCMLYIMLKNCIHCLSQLVMQQYLFLIWDYNLCSMLEVLHSLFVKSRVNQHLIDDFSRNLIIFTSVRWLRYLLVCLWCRGGNALISQQYLFSDIDLRGNQSFVNRFFGRCTMYFTLQKLTCKLQCSVG